MLPSSVLIVSRIILTRNATENLIRYPILSSEECEECLPASPGGKTPATARQHTRLQQVKTDTDRRKCYIALLAVLSVRCSYQTHTERMTKTHVHDSHTERATQKDRRKLHLCLTEQYANQCKVGNKVLIQRTLGHTSRTNSKSKKMHQRHTLKLANENKGTPPLSLHTTRAKKRGST